MPQPAGKPFPSNLPSGVRRIFAFFCCPTTALGWAQYSTAAANSSASGLLRIGIPSDLGDLLSMVVLVFLLLLGFGLMGRWFDGQRRPLVCMGLQFRAGWPREWATGAAIGWGIVIATVLPMAVLGDLHISLYVSPRNIWLTAVNAALLLVAALMEEVVYRGYPFQRLIDAIGTTAATAVMAGLFGLMHLWNPYHSLASTLNIVLAGVLLALAYIRTRALWLVWGIHFAWNFSMGMLLGLPVSGISRFGTVVQADTNGPLWLTGGDFGPEASGVMTIVLVVAIMVLVRVTRDANWKYNAPVFVPAGIPMEVAPPVAHTAMAADAAAAPAPLVQILPCGAPPEKQ